MAGTRQIYTTVDEPSSYGRQVLVGIAEYACRQGNWLILRQGDHADDLRKLAHVDGVIGQLLNEDLQSVLRRTGIPAVNVSGRDRIPDFPLVTIDNLAVGEMGARHLLDHGYTTLAFLQTTPHLYADLRRAGFLQVAQSHARNCQAFPEPSTFTIRSMERIWQDISRWLLALPKPVGLMVSDEFHAVRLTHICHSLRLHVPDDIAIISANDDPYECQMAYPPLSSVQVPGERVGFEAARVLDALLRGSVPPAAPLLLAPTGVTSRRSTEVYPIADADIRLALQFIQRHNHEAIDTRDVLEEIEIGRRTFERRFRALRGHSIRDEIRRARLAHVRHLLLTSTQTLKQIAVATGFGHSALLVRAFHQAFLMTPAVFRQQFGGRASCKPNS